MSPAFDIREMLMVTQNLGPRHWPGPIERLDEAERRSLLDTMSARPRPRIEIDEALRNYLGSERGSDRARHEARARNRRSAQSERNHHRHR
jgi:hypothetical protein